MGHRQRFCGPNQAQPFVLPPPYTPPPPYVSGYYPTSPSANVPTSTPSNSSRARSEQGSTGTVDIPIPPVKEKPPENVNVSEKRFTPTKERTGDALVVTMPADIEPEFFYLGKTLHPDCLGGFRSLTGCGQFFAKDYLSRSVPGCFTIERSNKTIDGKEFKVYTIHFEKPLQGNGGILEPDLFAVRTSPNGELCLLRPEVSKPEKTKPERSMPKPATPPAPDLPPVMPPPTPPNFSPENKKEVAPPPRPVAPPEDPLPGPSKGFASLSNSLQLKEQVLESFGLKNIKGADFWQCGQVTLGDKSVDTQKQINELFERAKQKGFLATSVAHVDGKQQYLVTALDENTMILDLHLRADSGVDSPVTGRGCFVFSRENGKSEWKAVYLDQDPSTGKKNVLEMPLKLQPNGTGYPLTLLAASRVTDALSAQKLIPLPDYRSERQILHLKSIFSVDEGTKSTFFQKVPQDLSFKSGDKDIVLKDGPQQISDLLKGKPAGTQLNVNHGKNFFTITAVDEGFFVVDLVTRASENSSSAPTGRARMVFRKDSSEGWKVMYLHETGGDKPIGGNPLNCTRGVGEFGPLGERLDMVLKGFTYPPKN